MDSFLTWLKWILVIAASSPIWGAFLWAFWEGSIRPRLIPKEDIITKADELKAKYGDEAFEHACINEHRGWYDSDMFEQGRWRRINEEIMRRDEKRGFKFSKVR